MTAALKMAAPGELCAQTQKLISFCTGNGRSIKEIKHHLAVTESRAHELINAALEHALIAKATGGKYVALAQGAAKQSDAETGATKAVDNSLAALGDDTTGELAGVFNVPTATGEDVEVVDVDEPGASFANSFRDVADMFTTELDKAKVRQQRANQLKAELTELTTLLNPPAPEQLPVVEQIETKQSTLDAVALLLKPRMPLIASTIEQLSVDLAEIKLHQDRRA
ncbi:hypothetical protein [Rheinheimera aquimaris]|uniref:hypothetical protein n=1 Tax=Rheinheimera aquimaris TaxID=412437 RepID=UPI003A978222